MHEYIVIAFLQLCPPILPALQKKATQKSEKMEDLEKKMKKMKSKSNNSITSKNNEDIISTLPDELLHNILSRLQINEAVQTCILSKRWTRVWTTLPHLNFFPFNYHPDDPTPYLNFVLFFISNRCPISRVASLRLWLHHALSAQVIDNVVRYAAFRNLNKLVLESLVNPRVLLPSTWSFPVLTSLHLANCVNVPLMSWGLPNLATLYLEDVTFRSGEKELGFEGFVRLRCLVLKGASIWHDLEVINVMSRSLKYLEVCQRYVVPRSCLFVISAPALSCFKYSGNFPMMSSLPESFPCVWRVDVDIDIEKYKWKKYFATTEKKQEYFHQIFRLFQQIGGAKFLTLSLNTIQVLSQILDFSKYPTSPFGERLKCVKLDKKGFRQWKGDKPTKSLDHVVIYLLSKSPAASILIQDEARITRDYNPRLNLLRWTCSNYSVVEPEDNSSGNEYAPPSAESRADEVNNSGEIIADSLKADAGEEKAKNMVLIPEADVVEVNKPIHVDWTCSCSMTSNLSLWEGHQVHSEFVDLLTHIKESYPETVEHFDPQTEVICTIGLNALCTAVSAYLEAMRSNITTSIISHYRALFSDLERWGFNTAWLMNHLNDAEELCSINSLIDAAQVEEPELQPDDAQKKMQELQDLRVVKMAKLSKILEDFGHFKAIFAA